MSEGTPNSDDIGDVLDCKGLPAEHPPLGVRDAHSSGGHLKLHQVCGALGDGQLLDWLLHRLQAFGFGDGERAQVEDDKVAGFGVLQKMQQHKLIID